MDRLDVARVDCRIAVMTGQRSAVGLSNTSDFLRPHQSGRLNVDAVAISQGRTQQLWQVEIRRSVAVGS